MVNSWCYARIRKNETGEIRIYKTKEYFIDSVDDENNYPSVFNWEENNYSCDCNREIFFEYSAGIEIDDVIEHCSDGRFSVNLYNTKNDECYYREFED